MYPNITMKQRLGLFERNEFEIIENTSIKVTYKSLFKTQTGKIPLELINPEPIRYKKVNVRTLIFFLISFSIFAASCYAWIGAPEESKIVHSTMGIIFGLFASITLNSFIKTSASAVLFNNIENGNILFAIYPSKSKKQDAETYIQHLCERIKSIRYQPELTAKQRKEIYHRHLKFLHSENVITNVEFKDLTSRVDAMNENPRVFQLV